MKEKTRQKRFFILTGLFMMLLAAGWGIKPHTVKAYVGTFNAAGKTFYMESGQYQTLLYRKKWKQLQTAGKNKTEFFGLQIFLWQ